MFLKFIYLALFLAFLAVLLKFVLFKKEIEKNKRKYNFPITYKGHEYWYSRAVATELYAYAQDENGELYILANKRGEGCPNANGLWNVPSGYLEFNETGEHRAVTECYEECGVEISEEEIKLVDVETRPLSESQNIKLRYFYQLPKTIGHYKFTDEHSEYDEVDEIKFIKLTELNEYEFAFGQSLIIEKLEKLINI